MIGKTLFFYIAWRFIKQLLAMMLLLLFLIVTVDFIETLRRVKEETDVSLGQIYLISLYTAPFYIDKAFPFACLFAAMGTLSQLNSKLELVVARAAGISAWQFLLPITSAAVFVGILASTLYNPAAIKLFETSLDMRAQYIGGNSRSNSGTKNGFWLRQQDENGSSVINAVLARDGGKKLTGVKVIRFDKDDLVYELIEAKRADHRGDKWDLRGVKVTDKAQKVTRKARLLVPTNVNAEYLLGSVSNPDSVTFWDLQKTAKKVASSGLNHLPYIVQFHSLLALPLFLVAMVIIAATVSLKFVRFGQTGRMILGGISSGFMLYALTRLVTSLGSNGVVPPLVAAWAPSMVAILFGIGMLLYQEDG
ncbi:MAG: LPS export ABC transporter permease LptG [Nitratireductor sp.]